MKPLLSICVPTYNRADLLRGCLECLSAEIAPFGDEVELIVSDNCSTDHTRDVVEDASKKAKIRYNRNKANLGFAGNIKILVEQLATGEFCWLIGDDDLLHKGAVKKVVDTIRQYPSINIIYMNLHYVDVKNRMNVIEHLREAIDISKITRIAYYRKTDAYLERGEDIIGFSDYAAFTQVDFFIFRRRQWRSIEFQQRKNDEILSTEERFPHITALAHAIIGKPCYYIGYPYLIFGTGSQEWFRREWPIIVFRDILQIAELFKQSGARKSMVDKYVDLVFKDPSIGRYFWRLTLKDKRVNCRGFSARALVCRYWRNPYFWKTIVSTSPLTVRITFYFKHPLELPRNIVRKLREALGAGRRGQGA